MQIRNIHRGDDSLLCAFFSKIPEDEKGFIKENQLDNTLAKHWVLDNNNAHLLAILDGVIIASVNIVPGVTISRHVGEIRLIVDPAHRGAGVGKALAREALIYSVSTMELKKVFVEVVAEQDATVGMFQKMGFVPEALLQDHLCDRHGSLHDIVILSHFVQKNWEGFEALGLDGEL